jgi:hypothetical protein
MSVSNVTGVSGVARIVLPANPNRPQEPAVAKEAGPKAVAAEAVMSDEAKAAAIGEAPPLRYPWLSRLARQLEPVSQQPSPYGTVELLGERLDKQA